MTRSRIGAIAVAVAVVAGGIALGVVGYHFLTADDRSPWWEAVPSIAIAWTYLIAGLIAWWRRPASRIGPLLLLVAASLLVRKLQYSGNSTLFTIGFALGSMYAACFAHVVLAYPTGRIRDRLERRFVAVAYAVFFLLPVGVLSPTTRTTRASSTARTSTGCGPTASSRSRATTPRSRSCTSSSTSAATASPVRSSSR